MRSIDSTSKRQKSKSSKKLQNVNPELCTKRVQVTSSMKDAKNWKTNIPKYWKQYAFWKRKVSIERICNTAQYIFMYVCTLNQKFSNKNIAKFRK